MGKTNSATIDRPQIDPEILAAAHSPSHLQLWLTTIGGGARAYCSYCPPSRVQTAVSHFANSAVVWCRYCIHIYFPIVLICYIVRVYYLSLDI